MTAHDDAFRDGLRERGLMAAFRRRVAELREAGQSKADSWTNAAIEFGYQPPNPRRTEHTNQTVDTAALLALARAATETFRDCPRREYGLPDTVAFALRNYHRVPIPGDPATWTMSPGEAPSAEAWNFLILAVDHPKLFLRLLVPLIAAKNRVAGRNMQNGNGAKVAGATNGRRKTPAELRKMLAEVIPRRK